MDLLVWSLCGEFKMSDQNAASWGYYDPVGKQWEEITLLQAGVHPSLLPSTVSVPCQAGTLLTDWVGIRQGTPIGVAMGDMQCSIYAAKPLYTDAGKFYPPSHTHLS